MREHIDTQVESDLAVGYLELIAGGVYTCDMPGCHAGAVLQAYSYANGRTWRGNRYCGFHGAALYGKRDARE